MYRIYKYHESLRYSVHTETERKRERERVTKQGIAMIPLNRPTNMDMILGYFGPNPTTCNHDVT